MIESYFRWSFFDASIDIETFFGQESEYKSPIEAENKHKIEDGEIAFDTGEPMYKFIFGIYSTPTMRRKFTADTFKKEHPNLVGCATILNWEWDRFYSEDEDVDDFRHEIVLEVLESEVEELTERFAERNYAPKIEEKVVAKQAASKKAAKKVVKSTKSTATKKSAAKKPATGSKTLFSPTKKAATKATKAKSTAKRKAVRTKKLQKTKRKAKR
jgi:hypothetical protein